MLALTTLHLADVLPLVSVAEAQGVPPRLALTGADLILPASIAVIIVVAGVALIVSARRRRAEAPDRWSLAALGAALLISLSLVAGGLAPGASQISPTAPASSEQSVTALTP